MFHNPFPSFFDNLVNNCMFVLFSWRTFFIYEDDSEEKSRPWFSKLELLYMDSNHDAFAIHSLNTRTDFWIDYSKAYMAVALRHRYKANTSIFKWTEDSKQHKTKINWEQNIRCFVYFLKCQRQAKESYFQSSWKCDKNCERYRAKWASTIKWFK